MRGHIDSTQSSSIAQRLRTAARASRTVPRTAQTVAPTTVLAALLVAVVMLAAGCRTVPEELGPDIVDPGWAQRPLDTTVEVELIEPFVKLVDLARLRVGMTKEEVRAIFPDPDEIQLQGTDEMWRYGFAELLFRGNYLRDWFDRPH